MSNTPDKHILKLWEMVVQQLDPPPTRVLLQENCQLIKFDIESSVAEIAVTSKSFAKLVYSKTPTLEKAFEEVLRKSVNTKPSLPCKNT